MQWLLSLLIVTCLCTVKWEGGRERRGWGGRGGSDVAKKKICGVIRCFVQKNSKSGLWMVH